MKRLILLLSLLVATTAQASAPTIVSNSDTIYDVSRINNCVLNVPPSLADFDVLVAFVVKSSNVGWASLPSGWTQVADLTQAVQDAHKVWIGYKVIASAAGEPSTYTWTSATADSQYFSGGIIALRNVNLLKVTDSTYSNSNTTNRDDPICPTLATVRDSAFVFRFASLTRTTTSNTVNPPSGATGIWSLLENTSTDRCSSVLSWHYKTPQGLTGTATWDNDYAGGDGETIQVTMAIRPEPDGIIGDSTVGASSGSILTSIWARARVGNATYTASAGDTVRAYWFYGTSGNAASDSVMMACYDVSSNTPANRLVAGTKVVTGNEASNRWNKSVEVAHGLTNGTVYCSAVGDATESSIACSYDDGSGDQTSTQTTNNDLAASWTHASFATRQWTFFAEVTHHTAASGGTTGRRRKLLQMGWRDEEQNGNSTVAGRVFVNAPSRRPLMYCSPFLENDR